MHRKQIAHAQILKTHRASLNGRSRTLSPKCETRKRILRPGRRLEPTGLCHTPLGLLITLVEFRREVREIVHAAPEKRDLLRLRFGVSLGRGSDGRGIEEPFAGGSLGLDRKDVANFDKFVDGGFRIERDGDKGTTLDVGGFNAVGVGDVGWHVPDAIWGAARKLEGRSSSGGENGEVLERRDVDAGGWDCACRIGREEWEHAKDRGINFDTRL